MTVMVMAVMVIMTVVVMIVVVAVTIVVMDMAVVMAVTVMVMAVVMVVFVLVVMIMAVSMAAVIVVMVVAMLVVMSMAVAVVLMVMDLVLVSVRRGRDVQALLFLPADCHLEVCPADSAADCLFGFKDDFRDPQGIESVHHCGGVRMKLQQGRREHITGSTHIAFKV